MIKSRAFFRDQGILLTIFAMFLVARPIVAADEPNLRAQARDAMQRAAEYYHSEVATNGGYVYFYSLDLRTRWGEGQATETQVWVQPPGTPTVGMAFVDAYESTGDRRYLDAATDAAMALVYGQLRSGGWTNRIDFDPNGSGSADYRNGKGRGRNHSSLDDDQTPAALRLLMRVDKAHEFQHEAVREAVRIGLDALLEAQFPNGGFPQVWTGPVEDRPILRARYPQRDWQNTERIKNYWDMYTLNDNVCGNVARTLVLAHETYDDPRYLEALKKLGDFLILARLPGRQAGWAQQYDTEMRPIWARQFEPPAIASDETQEAISTLLTIAEVTGDNRYLTPIPAALRYLERSLLEDGRLARYYELRTNRPLYMVRDGGGYTPTFSDENLPSHYAWKVDSRVDELEERLNRVRRGENTENPAIDSEEVQHIIDELDGTGRWVSTYRDENLIGQPKMASGAKYLSSERFSHNISLLSKYLSTQN